MPTSTPPPAVHEARPGVGRPACREMAWREPARLLHRLGDCQRPGSWIPLPRGEAIMPTASVPDVGGWPNSLPRPMLAACGALSWSWFAHQNATTACPLIVHSRAGIGFAGPMPFRSQARPITARLRGLCNPAGWKLSRATYGVHISFLQTRMVVPGVCCSSAAPGGEITANGRAPRGLAERAATATARA